MEIFTTYKISKNQEITQFSLESILACGILEWLHIIRKHITPISDNKEKNDNSY